MSKLADWLKKNYLDAKKTGVPLEEFKDLQKFAKEVEQIEKELDNYEKKLAELMKLKELLVKKMELVNKQVHKWDKPLHHVQKSLPKHKGAQDFFGKMNMVLNHIEITFNKERLEKPKKA
ncbi:MAG TPA: hypothetical protein VLA12_23905 [Planctomycetaceae bacterium]|nr:hypothetical protein [Planctomycetaceae bacterium]